LQHSKGAKASRLPAPLLLHLAAERPQSLQPLEVCRLLVDQAAFDPSSCDRFDGQTTLFKAAAAGNADVCSYLLEARCNVNHLDVGGQTAIFAAARSTNNTLEALRVLLKAGASASAQDSDRTTPLAAAATVGHEEVLRELVAAQADVNAANKIGQTALWIAIRDTRPRFARLLLAEFRARLIGPSRTDNIGNFDMFHMAQERGLVEIVELLEGARKRQDRELKMLEVVGTGTLEEIAALLASGLSVNASGAGGLRPLHRAVSRLDGSALPCCRLLLEQHGADPALRDATLLETPLFPAACAGFEDCVTLLLDSRCDPTVANRDGDSALFEAVRHGHLDIAALLIERGADAAHRNARGQTPLFFAPTLRTALLLLEHRCDPCVRDTGGQTALFAASQKGLAEVVEVLLQRGTEADARDKHGTSALHLAVGPQVCRLLLAARAGVNAQDTDKGQTPLFQIAARGDAAAVKVLLRAGADGKKLDKDKKSVLVRIIGQGASLEVVGTLVREICPDGDMLDNAKRAAFRSPKCKADVQAYLHKVAMRYGAAALRKRKGKGHKVRRRYALVFEDPATGLRLDFGAAEYEAALQRLRQGCPEAFPAVEGGQPLRLTRGPPPLRGAVTAHTTGTAKGAAAMAVGAEASKCAAACGDKIDADWPAAAADDEEDQRSQRSEPTRV